MDAFVVKTHEVAMFLFVHFSIIFEKAAAVFPCFLALPLEENSFTTTSIYLFKVNKENSRESENMFKFYYRDSRTTILTCSSVFITNFEHISHLF